MGRKKDRNEPSFKRSESFKRISIRKSYLDRGKRRNKLQKSLEPTVPLAVDPNSDEKPLEKTIIKEDIIKKEPKSIVAKDDVSIKEQLKPKKLQDDTLSRESISYDEWLQGVSSSSREKLDEDQPQNKSQQQQHGRSKNCRLSANSQKSSEAADHVAEDLKVLELEASPVLPSKPFRASNEAVQEKGSEQEILQAQELSVEGPPSVSISLGRIWRDAVPVPYPSSSGPSVHHSLDSALKERKPQPTVARTVSAPEKTVAGKDVSSAFGFSLRIAKLADFRAGLLSIGILVDDEIASLAGSVFKFPRNFEETSLVLFEGNRRRFAIEWGIQLQRDVQ